MLFVESLRITVWTPFVGRLSANELQGQLEIVADLGDLNLDYPIHDRCEHLGQAFTKLLGTLTG